MVIYKEVVPLPFCPYSPMQYPTPAHGGGCSCRGSHARTVVAAGPATGCYGNTYLHRRESKYFPVPWGGFVKLNSLQAV